MISGLPSKFRTVISPLAAIVTPTVDRNLKTDRALGLPIGEPSNTSRMIPRGPAAFLPTFLKSISRVLSIDLSLPIFSSARRVAEASSI